MIERKENLSRDEAAKLCIDGWKIYGASGSSICRIVWHRGRLAYQAAGCKPSNEVAFLNEGVYFAEREVPDPKPECPVPLAENQEWWPVDADPKCEQTLIQRGEGPRSETLSYVESMTRFCYPVHRAPNGEIVRGGSGEVWCPKCVILAWAQSHHKTHPLEPLELLGVVMQKVQ